jgi:hypothetical protein
MQRILVDYSENNHFQEWDGKQEYTIKMNLKERDCGDADCIKLTRNWFKHQRVCYLWHTMF